MSVRVVYRSFVVPGTLFVKVYHFNHWWSHFNRYLWANLMVLGGVIGCSVGSWRQGASFTCMHWVTGSTLIPCGWWPSVALRLVS